MKMSNPFKNISKGDPIPPQKNGGETVDDLIDLLCTYNKEFEEYCNSISGCVGCDIHNFKSKLPKDVKSSFCCYTLFIFKKLFERGNGNEK